MYLLLQLYPYIIKTCLAFFDCVQLDNSGKFILRADEKLICYESTWNSYLVLVVCHILFYLNGILLFFHRTINGVRGRYPPEELYKSGSALNSFYTFTGFLCRKYHPIAYLYGFIVIARKSLISIITTTSNMNGGTDPEIYLFLFASIYFAFGVVHLLRQPLRTKELNLLEAALTLIIQIGGSILHI